MLWFNSDLWNRSKHFPNILHRHKLSYSSPVTGKVTFISIKQVIGSNVDILILNPTLVWPEKKKCKWILYLFGVWFKLLSDFLCVIVGNDWLFMDLAKYQQSFTWIYFNIVILIFIRHFFIIQGCYQI